MRLEMCAETRVYVSVIQSAFILLSYIMYFCKGEVCKMYSDLWLNLDDKTNENTFHDNVLFKKYSRCHVHTVMNHQSNTLQVAFLHVT